MHAVAVKRTYFLQRAGWKYCWIGVIYPGVLCLFWCWYGCRCVCMPTVLEWCVLQWNTIQALTGSGCQKTGCRNGECRNFGVYPPASQVSSVATDWTTAGCTYAKEARDQLLPFLADDCRQVSEKAASACTNAFVEMPPFEFPRTHIFENRRFLVAGSFLWTHLPVNNTLNAAH